MAKDVLAIGSSPCDEDCAQVGSEGYYERAQAECRRFIELLRRTFGPEPEGAELFIKANLHDFGTYYEVACRFDPDAEAAVDYALKCEGDAPPTWEG